MLYWGFGDERKILVLVCMVIVVDVLIGELIIDF